MIVEVKVFTTHSSCHSLSVKLLGSSSLTEEGETNQIMFATLVRLCAKKSKPKLKPIELKTPPEQTQTIMRAIFEIVKEHGPLTISDTWEHVKDVGLRGLTSKRHMKIVLRWMRERQKLRLICNHVGPHRQFIYSTWFTKPNLKPSRPKSDTSRQ